MLTISQKLIKRFGLIDHAQDSRCNPILLDGFIATCEHLSTDSFETNRKSFDSPRCYKFEDGSALYLGNPCQVLYGAYVSEMGTLTRDDFDTVKENRFY